jgi:hypothetical protein
MKSIKHIVWSFLVVAVIASCGDDDNYPAPAETFKGTIVDKENGEPLQTDIGGYTGGSGVRIKMMEYSWSDTPTPYYMYTEMDGTFNNTRIFKGNYGVTVEGPFVTLPEEKFDISGTVEKTYEVEPFLRVEWVGEPVVNDDGTATVQVKISRGTANPDYQQALTEVWLYVSETQYVGAFSNSLNFSTKLTGVTLPALDATTSITTGWPVGMKAVTPTAVQKLFPTYARKYFLRVGARINKQAIGTNVFNYTTVKEITTKAR